MTKDNYYFISPHLDDAAFSAGALMTALSQKHKVTVVTVFTKGGRYNTLSAKQYLKQCGYPSAQVLYKKRNAEDIQALSSANIQAIHLGYTEALWRRIPGRNYPIEELNAVYPTYKVHISRGRISKYDSTLITHIATRLKKTIKDKHAKIFCSVGHGHLDHMLVRLASEQAFGQARLTYWLDFPYSQHTFFDPTNYSQAELLTLTDNNYRHKLTLARLYKSQYRIVISSDEIVTSTSESYFILRVPNNTSVGNNTRLLKVGKYMGIVTVLSKLVMHILAFLASPKDYLFVLFTAKDKNVHTRRNKLKNKSQKLLSDLGLILKPGTIPILIGSLGIGETQGDDIDIIIGCESNEIGENRARISKYFGSPIKNRTNSSKWQFMSEEAKVELDLVTFTHPRYFLQLRIVSAFLEYPQLRTVYRQLKLYWDNLSARDDGLSEIVFFRYILKHYHSVTNFPKKIGPYTFDHKITNIQNQSTYQYAIYRDMAGNKYFGKFLSNKADLVANRLLINEQYVYKHLASFLRTNQGKVKTPRLIATGVTHDTRYLILENIQSSHLGSLPSETTAKYIYMAMQYIKKLGVRQPRDIAVRPPYFWLALSPLLAIKASIRNPRLSWLYLRMILRLIVSSPALVSRTSRTLIHRDLSRYNLLRSQGNLYLIDFQLTCWADPLVEQAIVILKFYADKDFLSKWYRFPGVVSPANTSTQGTVLRAYLAIFALYDQALAIGNHPISEEVIRYLITQQSN